MGTVLGGNRAFTRGDAKTSVCFTAFLQLCVLIVAISLRTGLLEAGLGCRNSCMLPGRVEYELLPGLRSKFRANKHHWQTTGFSLYSSITASSLQLVLDLEATKVDAAAGSPA